MPPTYLSIALILGSARHGRRCEPIARWVRSEIEAANDLVVDTIDPQHMPLSLTDQPLPRHSWQNLETRLHKADAFVVVTPEYNHGYTGALKQVIDAAQAPWRAKPVGFVSYGGVSGGLRAVEQLRQVFSELHTTTLADTLSIAHIGQHMAIDDRFAATDTHVRRLDTLIDRLRWWAVALRNARRLSPYDEALACTA